MNLARVSVIGLFAALFISSFYSCKKESFLNTGGELQFSTDTVSFDTVFTEFASFTLGVKIFNPQNQKVNVSNVRLEKGESSFFSLNVDGVAGKTVNNTEVAANDSFYVFVNVRIDPTNENSPFIIEDRLIATLNGKEFSIPLYAYGQNAHYIFSDIETNTTWINDKPYVLRGDRIIKNGATLTIEPGCKVYMNQDSRLFVDGTLIANATKRDSIIFQGNRLDRAYFGYEGYPGEWGGLYFTKNSTNSILNWVIIKNCGNSAGGVLPAAIQVDGSPGIPTQLTMTNTIIENAIGYGLLSFTGNIKAQNCLMHTCGAQALAILQGGTYSFDNCDFLNFGTDKVKHLNEPTVAVLNYFDVSETERRVADLSASFKNCIMYGSIEDEVFFAYEEAALHSVSLANCILRSKEVIPAFVVQTDCKVNADPLFRDIVKWDYRLKDVSPAIDAGVTVPGISNDLDDNTWITPFDIGCYQF